MDGKLINKFKLNRVAIWPLSNACAFTCPLKCYVYVNACALMRYQ